MAARPVKLPVVRSLVGWLVLGEGDLTFIDASASVMRVTVISAGRATSALADRRRRSRLPHSGNSCSTVKKHLVWRGTLVRSMRRK